MPLSPSVHSGRASTSHRREADGREIEVKRILRVLNVEDNPGDSELVHTRLTEEGIACDFVRVETKEEFAAAIKQGGFDLILADYSLPSFDGLSALKMAKTRCPEIPFIFVSGAIGEEFAIETLKRGATDYVLKDRLSRLAAAINRALLEVEGQTKRRQAEKELEAYQKHLEELVSERTTDLNKANKQLHRELSERKKAEETLYRREREFKALVENAPDIVQRFDKELRHLYINPAVERVTGVSPQAFVGKTYRELGFPKNFLSIWERALQKVFERGRESVIEFEMPTTHGGGYIEARLVPELSKDGSLESVLAISRDITDRKKLEEQLRTASITDELTGLLNRRGFLIFAQKHFEVAKRNKRPFSILYLDLNEMKKINDEFGHKEGDQALIDISNILKKSFRASDIIARIGGDEFTVLISEPPRSELERTVAQHIQDNLRVHNEQTEKGYKLSGSMGMVHYDPEHPSSVEELLARADELMYEHKQHRELKSETIPSSKGGKKEERAYDRYETEDKCLAELVVSGSAMIKNISFGGISLRTPQRLPKNTIYKIKILRNNHAALSLKGLVIWSSLTEKGFEKDDAKPYYEAGLRFIDLNDSLTSSLENMINVFANTGENRPS
jgi:diguanylate cyclase (GGDEF)-like protein/PAS domain S-box-containing protein